MNHFMVLSYNYAKRKWRRQRTNAPLLLAISMAMRKRWSDTCSITGCTMQHVQGHTGSHWTPPSGNYLLRIASAATRATENKTTMWYVPTLMAILMVIAMRRYCTAHIAWWRRSRAFIKATKHHHRARTRSDIAQSDTPTPVVSSILSWKWVRVDMLAPNNNRGMTYQTEDNNLPYLLEYFFGVVTLVIYC